MFTYFLTFVSSFVVLFGEMKINVNAKELYGEIELNFLLDLKCFRSFFIAFFNALSKGILKSLE